MRREGDGLALVRGKWVEIDSERLDAVLAHWKTAQESAHEGVSFLDAMRMIAGAKLREDDTSDDAARARAEAAWSTVRAGDWLAGALASLRSPEGRKEADPGGDLKATLRPYQAAGVSWLWTLHRLGLGGCLADDMGLGKTIQVIAFLLLLKRHEPGAVHLLVLPASLLGNWKSELDRFAPSLRVLIAHSAYTPQQRLEELERSASVSLDAYDVVITTYGGLPRLPWLVATKWGALVLDEAQAIKNPGTKHARAAKALRARTRLALTGTPVENRSGDLWSLFDFVLPGHLGSAKEFGRFTRKLAAEPTRGYAPLRALVRPYVLRRLKTDRSIIDDLPEKTEVRAYAGLSKRQIALYQEAADALGAKLRAAEGIERRGAILASLTRFKQICNHPSQWLRDGAYAPADSGKLLRLAEIAETIAARREKVLVFTQFREMVDPLARFLAPLFGRPGLVLHGETAIKSRKALVDAFQGEDGPPFFVLSLKAGGTGLNLTADEAVETS